MQMDGKVAIVTGGASGIGAACAETLARAGASVVMTDIDQAGGESVVGKISAAGGKALFLDQDVTDEARWPRHPGDAACRGWLDHPDVVGGGTARIGRPRRLLRDQGWRAPP